MSRLEALNLAKSYKSRTVVKDVSMTIDSGQIVIQAVVGKSKFQLMWDWYAKALKLRDRNANSREFTGKSFQLETFPNLKISIDGEVLATTPVQVRIAKKAVEVAFP